MNSLRFVVPILLSGLALTASPSFAADAPAATAPAASKDDIVAALPVIPDAKFNLKDFGAVGDYKTDNTPAFQKAIAAIEAAGGGHLIVEEGIYKTLPFQLTSHMDLHLNPGAVIKAPDTFADYGLPDPADVPPGGRYTGRVGPFISGNNLTDVAITGSGTIDGSGAIFWMWSDKIARRYPEGRISIPRPQLITLSGQRLHVDGVTLSNSPSFHLVPRGSDITIENIRISTPSDAPNTDAMDPSGQRIVIRNSEIDTGDDDVAIQQGSSDVLIEGMTILHGHGISIGSGTTRGVSHMIVRDCTFDGTDNGLRIKSYRGGGGEVHDISYSNIAMKNVRRPIDLNLLYNGNTPTIMPNGLQSDVGARDADDPMWARSGGRNIPNFHDIHYSNITITNSPVAGRIVGVAEQPPHDITFTNFIVHSDRGLLIQDGGANISLTNVTIVPLVGDPLVLDKATVKFNGTDKTGPIGGSPEVFYGGN